MKNQNHADENSHKTKQDEKPASGTQDVSKNGEETGTKTGPVETSDTKEKDPQSEEVKEKEAIPPASNDEEGDEDSPKNDPRFKNLRLKPSDAHKLAVEKQDGVQMTAAKRVVNDVAPRNELSEEEKREAAAFTAKQSMR